ncbi:MAG: NAD(P)(+) transhydrogenase (Re/Si-specific) subunit beta, partial [Pseudomonadota bacterium]|nr:NAD(P)(+) transhydrogenase (Re/Si-specific) subunit beta [Pseudomonadota bacterium]
MFSSLAASAAYAPVECFGDCNAATGEAVNPWVALAYLVSGVFFILALRGLSSPATSRTGNRFGMIGMLIAVVTTLVTHFPGVTFPGDVIYPNGSIPADFRPDWASFGEIFAAIAIGAV